MKRGPEFRRRKCSKLGKRTEGIELNQDGLHNVGLQHNPAVLPFAPCSLCLASKDVVWLESSIHNSTTPIMN